MQLVSCYLSAFIFHGLLALCGFKDNFELDAATIALLYKYRWQIEFFFKWVKQHLRITAFYGTSANAVMIQIYTAFIAFCVIALAALNMRGVYMIFLI